MLFPPRLSTGRSTTNRMMAEVLIALVPVAAAAIYFFGVVAILVPAASTLGACAVEWLAGDRRGWAPCATAARH
ncbi:MAG: RnfABCDGE type electron transport complex subunit D [Deltaproteobacteria bacterium]|nr:RnfABCDGE type electron transport complex subunit D [Deltaproteobacteria bacterium]